MSRDPNCIFCKIVVGEIPALVVLNTPDVLGFLDIGPLSEGHVLLVPKSHAERLTDLSRETAGAIGGLLPAVGRALVKVTEADGFNVLQNNGAVAGQVVGHVHFHLIPRSAGDGLGYRWIPGTYPEGRAETVAHALRDALARA